MLRRVVVLSSAALILCAFPHAPALGACGKFLGKQITLRGSVTSVERLQIGNTKFDVIIARTTDPACGTIQTTGKAQSCSAGMRFVATGELKAGPASRSAGSKRPGATDYGFVPVTEDGLCR